MYRVTNQTKITRTLTTVPIQGVEQVTTAGNCPSPFTLGPNEACLLELEIRGEEVPPGGIQGGPQGCKTQGPGNNSPNPFLCSQPATGNQLKVSRGPSLAILSVNPTTLLFAENSTGEVTVTNSADSPKSATNVVAQIPGVSSISVQSTTCGSSLPIGASCAIIFASGSQEGPTAIPVAGDNTNTVNVDVTVTSQPQISITNPMQQSRVVTVSGAALSLEVTNDAGSAVNANAITVSNPGTCTDLSVNDSNCTSVAPGGSCNLLLTSPTPYAPCTITISGDNTANSLHSSI